MISRKKSNFIISLGKKRVRDEEKLYVIEGDKLIREFLAAGVELNMLVAKPEFIGSLKNEQKQGIQEIIPASFEDLKRISTLKTPHNALAVVGISEKKPDLTILNNELSVALDTIQDPGNLGTIIRAAAWFGIKNIYCSSGCVDVYNPKVIQATMGAILCVNVYYINLGQLLQNALEKNIRIYGAVIGGESIWSQKLEKKGIIVLGNESKGLSDEILKFVNNKITIPGCGEPGPGIDSLNVGMAASVIFSEFCRRKGSSEE